MTLSWRSVLLLALLLGMLAVAIELTTRELIRPWTVVGPSMTPTLFGGDRVLVDLWTYRHRQPLPGEILLIRGPKPDEALLVKRCSIPPSFDTTRPHAGVWLPPSTTRSQGIWVLGDNSRESLDSRRFGSVPRDRIVGRVVYRYWPVGSAGRTP